MHPPGTPYNEALMMRSGLLELGIQPNRFWSIHMRATDDKLAQCWSRHAVTGNGARTDLHRL